jgi:hypothetical protein
MTKRLQHNALFCSTAAVSVKETAGGSDFLPAFFVLGKYFQNRLLILENINE